MFWIFIVCFPYILVFQIFLRIFCGFRNENILYSCFGHFECRYSSQIRIIGNYRIFWSKQFIRQKYSTHWKRKCISNAMLFPSSNKSFVMYFNIQCMKIGFCRIQNMSLQQIWSNETFDVNSNVVIVCPLIA